MAGVAPRKRARILGNGLLLRCCSVGFADGCIDSRRRGSTRSMPEPKPHLRAAPPLSLARSYRRPNPLGGGAPIVARFTVGNFGRLCAIAAFRRRSMLRSTGTATLPFRMRGVRDRTAHTGRNGSVPSEQANAGRASPPRHARRCPALPTGGCAALQARWAAPWRVGLKTRKLVSGLQINVGQLRHKCLTARRVPICQRLYRLRTSSDRP
jgi:hypothetical protein